jgi:hypothetical protein
MEILIVNLYILHQIFFVSFNIVQYSNYVGYIQDTGSILKSAYKKFFALHHWLFP